MDRGRDQIQGRRLAVGRQSSVATADGWQQLGGRVFVGWLACSGLLRMLLPIQLASIVVGFGRQYRREGRRAGGTFFGGRRISLRNRWTGCRVRALSPGRIAPASRSIIPR
jgi:hypothetical protein